MSTQAVEQRESRACARLLRALLEEAVGQVISSEASVAELVSRFNGVYLQDGTVLSLPASLAPQWRGSGKGGEASGFASASATRARPRAIARSLAAGGPPS